MMKIVAQAAACALALATAGNAAQARVLVGAGIGISQFDYDDVDDGSATRYFGAYEMDDGPAFFEVAIIDSGDADIAGFSNINVSGLQFGAGYRAILNPDTGTSLYAKAGLYDTDTEIEGFGKDGNTGFYLGVGGDVMFTPSFGLRFDMQGLLGVEDFADDNSVTFITLGPLVKFGGMP